MKIQNDAIYLQPEIYIYINIHIYIFQSISVVGELMQNFGSVMLVSGSIIYGGPMVGWESPPTVVTFGLGIPS